MMNVDAVDSYHLIYKALIKRVGPGMSRCITGMSPDIIDTHNPVSQVRALVQAINRLFGTTQTKYLVREALRKKFTEQFTEHIMGELGL